MARGFALDNDQAAVRMKILVDADACPVIPEINDVAGEFAVPVTLVSNYCHDMEQYEGVTIVIVDKEADAVDLAVANLTVRGDIVVTQDYGLAALALGKGASAISPRGRIFGEHNIEGLLHKRHISRKQRKRGIRTRGPKPMTIEDRKTFARNLHSLIQAAR
jgi:uncharacterized protein YaiI (UPF0178 family)